MGGECCLFVCLFDLEKGFFRLKENCILHVTIKPCITITISTDEKHTLTTTLK